ncbi:putative 60S ribosomal protein L7 [Paratrimastix pyriformis]|uniref:60S ribosomal protein L7 n=1 Tax=Paratrimastix pyriformis TaxID=342808 RepID=A0ABQ8UI34_9EUKA|nr:putative 60S ribosomal protein L7 [Paratrimastix pyriformis]
MVKKNENFTRVPETILKRRKTVDELKAKHIEQSAQQKKKLERIKAQKSTFKHAEDFVKEARAVQRSRVRDKKYTKKAERNIPDPTAPVLFVIRLRGITKVTPDVRRILHKFRLDNGNEGTFVKVDHPTMQLLRRIEPYITYGAPTLESIRELITKRGYAKADGARRVPLSDNRMVEEHLGSCGMLCVEDLVHELSQAGPNFDKVNEFLWPFKLNTPPHGITKRPVHLLTKGESGDRADAINPLIASML